ISPLASKGVTVATKDPSTRLLDMKRLPFSPVRSGYDGRRGKIRYRGWRILSAPPSYPIGRCVIARGTGGACHAESPPAARLHAMWGGPAPPPGTQPPARK